MILDIVIIISFHDPGLHLRVLTTTGEEEEKKSDGSISCYVYSVGLACLEGHDVRVSN